MSAGLWPIDCAARGGGAMIYTHVLPAVSGVDAVAASIQAALGRTPDLRTGARQAACVAFARTDAGWLRAVQGLERLPTLPGVLGWHVAAQPGDRLGVAVDKDARPAWVVAGAPEFRAGARACPSCAAGLELGDSVRATAPAATLGFARRARCGSLIHSPT